MTNIVNQLEKLADVMGKIEVPEDRGPVKTTEGKHVGCPECGYPLGSQDGEIMPCALCGWGSD